MKMRKIGTRLLVGILMTMMVAVPVIAIEEQRKTEYERTGQLLSELTEEECLAFVISKNVEIPERLGTEHVEELVKYMIIRAEQYPQMGYGMLSNIATINLGESVRKVVNEYYGIDGGKYDYAFEGDTTLFE